MMTVKEVGYLYVIDTPFGTKVGMSRSPKKRTQNLCKTFGIENPKVFISNKTINPFEIEKKVHKKLNAKSKTGEFFSNDFDFVVRVIKSNIVKPTSEDIELLRLAAKKEQERMREFANNAFNKPACQQELIEIIKHDLINTYKIIDWKVTEEVTECKDLTLLLMKSLLAHKEVSSQVFEMHIDTKGRKVSRS